MAWLVYNLFFLQITFVVLRFLTELSEVCPPTEQLFSAYNLFTCILIMNSGKVNVFESSVFFKENIQKFSNDKLVNFFKILIAFEKV